MNKICELNKYFLDDEYKYLIAYDENAVSHIMISDLDNRTLCGKKLYSEDSKYGSIEEIFCKECSNIKRPHSSTG